MKTSEYENRCRQIRLVITDVDGVLTDGGMYYSENGDELKKFNVRDGVGVVLLQLAGLKVGSFTGENTQMVERRLRKIGMDFMFSNVKDKSVCLNDFIKTNNISADQIAYVGDEINDYCLLGKVGLFFTVADANPDIISKADVVLECKGGQGALREIARILLTAQGQLQAAIDKYVSSSKRNSSCQEIASFVEFTRED